MGAALEFLSRYHTDGEDFSNRIVTGDEIWVGHVNAETKQQSVAWSHTGSPTWLRKGRKTLSAKKLIVTVFWDAQEILLIEFMTREKTVNSEVFCRKLKQLKRAIQNKRRGLPSSNVELKQDNTLMLLLQWTKFTDKRCRVGIMSCADSDDENEMNNAASVPTSSEMSNVLKSMRSYLEAHSNAKRNNKMDDIEQFVDKKDNAKINK
ncbi:histone-lysine N-methyltransferase SETMAR [Trichonephila clavipes]|nr:histone-lysine N-methyltransferase SETMAR [Trichonephila clavipes]